MKIITFLKIKVTEVNAKKACHLINTKFLSHTTLTVLITKKTVADYLEGTLKFMRLGDFCDLFLWAFCNFAPVNSRRAILKLLERQKEGALHFGMRR